MIEMAKPKSLRELPDLLSYLAQLSSDEEQRIPSLSELSKILDTSVASLREQLEVARFLGIVEVKPKAGIKRLPYRFKPALITSLVYAVESESIAFEQYGNLRRHLEVAYFIEAVRSLTPADIERLTDLVSSAQEKLREIPGKIPVMEHREYHLLIYRNLQNEFLNGIMEAYWDLYRIEGLEVYSDLAYAERVWQYHGRIVDQIKTGNFNQALRLLTEHMDLLDQRGKTYPRLSFE
jgi:DNA-binding FadR family transcriptional regulator